MKPEEERFWAKVKRGAPDECWPWTAFKRKSGHGLTSLCGFPIHAHRKAWILTHGVIRDDELCVNHRCDNAACCNPAHMYLGTRADNMIDLWAKTPPDERSARGRPHKLTDEQLRLLAQRRREGKTLKQCAEEFGVHLDTIRRCITTYRKARLQVLRAARLSASAK